MSDEPINPRGHICTLYPWHIRMALVEAAAQHDHAKIDALTRELVHLGFVRAPGDAPDLNLQAEIVRGPKV